MDHRICSSCFFILILVFSINAQNDDWFTTINGLLKICIPRSRDFDGGKSFLNGFKQCVQQRALTVMDRILSDNVIPVLDGISFVRFQKSTLNDTDSPSRDMNEARDVGKKSWREIVFNRFSRVLKTHVLKIDVEKLTSSKNTEETARENTDGLVEGRRRHHKRRNPMMPMLMMGMLVMGSVLIPMGFQFLAVLGGKALILAKLALMLSSIQGLKKVATSGVNYGLYHNPGGEGWHDRSHRESIAGNNYEIPYQPYQYQAYQNI